MGWLATPFFLIFNYLIILIIFKILVIFYYFILDETRGDLVIVG
jgi:hypothetical protein